MSLRIMSLVWQTECATHTQKLVLLALADNASDEGRCWPSIDTLANKCSLSRQAVINNVNSLRDAGKIKVEKSTGEVNQYVVTPVNVVDQSTRTTSQPDLPPLVNGVDYHQSTGLTTPVNGVDPNRKEPSIEPPKEPSVLFAFGEPEKPPKKSADEIYDLYPRKVSRKKCIPIIIRCAKKYGADFLKERVLLYSKTVSGSDQSLIPHPSTWFNQERFNDDPSTWKINQRGSSYPQVVNRNLGNSNSELDPNDYANLKCPN